MGIFNALINLKNLFLSKTLSDITGVKTSLSTDMNNAILLWNEILQGKAQWNTEAPSCGVQRQIATELSNSISQEIGIEVKNDSIRIPLEHLNKNIGKVIEYITLLGGCIFRPVFANNKLQYELIQLGNYLPIEYDFDGTLTSALLLKNIVTNNKVFLLTEEHSYKNKTHSVKCTLYKNENNNLIKCPLSACELTKDLTPEYHWENVPIPMIIEFRSNLTNTIDGSNVPVALINGAENLIRQADEHWARMNWEQESGQKIVFADSDLFKKRISRKGTEIQSVKLSPKLNKLITMIDGDGSTDGTKIKEYSPTLRTIDQTAFLQQIFKRIELTLGLGKGTVSDLENVQQTATQYNGGKKSYYTIVNALEDEIEQKYYLCAQVLAYMASAYGLGSNDCSILIEWDDMIRKDPTEQKQIAMQEVNAGIMSKAEYRMKFYGEDEQVALENVPKQDTSFSVNNLFSE